MSWKLEQNAHENYQAQLSRNRQTSLEWVRMTSPSCQGKVINRCQREKVYNSGDHKANAKNLHRYRDGGDGDGRKDESMKIEPMGIFVDRINTSQITRAASRQSVLWESDVYEKGGHSAMYDMAGGWNRDGDLKESFSSHKYGQRQLCSDLWSSAKVVSLRPPYLKVVGVSI